ncbi:MAG: glycoside hydrolase family 3 C-terminal domain-containing protein, partial [Bacteroidales bacterium]
GEPPESGLTDDDYRIEWTVFLVPRKDGIHALGVEGKFVTLILDGDTVIHHRNIHHPDKNFIQMEMISGRPYRVKVIMEDRQGDASCTLHWQEPDQPLLWEALNTARWADHVVLVMGLSARLEGEEMRGLDLDGFHAGDRTSLELPDVQQQLIRAVAATGKPVTLVLMSGSALDLQREQQVVPSVLQAWYGGEAAGTAVADVLFGDYNPAGRLPVTFYRSVGDLPPFEAYEMEGRTYRYFEGEVLYPFGFGLSYTRFKYDNLLMEKNEVSSGEQLMVSVDVTNSGDRDGDEVVQLYVRYPDSEVRRPLKELKEFRRIRIGKGQTKAVTMLLDTNELATYDESAADYRLERGTYQILVGPSSDETGLLMQELTVR